MQNKKLVVILAIFVAIVIAAAIYMISPDKFSALRDLSRTIGLEKGTPQVIEEKLVIPETKKITGAEGKIVIEGAVSVPLVPKTEAEKVVVAKAVLTVKGSYDLAVSEAKKWSTDALPVFIKSLGAVTLDGKSSQWQLAFSSKSKSKKGYEIIIQADQIVSKKEIDSSVKGVNFPANMPDSGEFVKKLQERPVFADATFSSFLLASTPESTDVKWWFSISTSKGTVTFEVK